MNSLESVGKIFLNSRDSIIQKYFIIRHIPQSLVRSPDKLKTCGDRRIYRNGEITIYISNLQRGQGTRHFLLSAGWSKTDRSTLGDILQ